MGLIKRIGICGDSGSMENFYKRVADNTNEFQNEGLEVEIQYQFSHGTFTALIIGRTVQANRLKNK